MPDGKEPSYDLAEIQAKVQAGFFVITQSSAEGAGRLGFDSSDIRDCICGMDETDFHKSMPSEKRPGLMQDVYRPTYQSIPLYVKLQLNKADRAVVVSFKER